MSRINKTPATIKFSKVKNKHGDFVLGLKRGEQAILQFGRAQGKSMLLEELKREKGVKDG